MSSYWTWVTPDEAVAVKVLSPGKRRVVRREHYGGVGRRIGGLHRHHAHRCGQDKRSRDRANPQSFAPYQPPYEASRITLRREACDIKSHDFACVDGLAVGLRTSRVPVRAEAARDSRWPESCSPPSSTRGRSPLPRSRRVGARWQRGPFRPGSDGSSRTTAGTAAVDVASCGCSGTP